MFATAKIQVECAGFFLARVLEADRLETLRSDGVNRRHTIRCFEFRNERFAALSNCDEGKLDILFRNTAVKKGFESLTDGIISFNKELSDKLNMQ